MLLKPSWILLLLTIKIFLKRQRKIVGECDFPIQNSYTDQVGSMLVHGPEIVTSLVQSAITCTQDWNVVQYLVNKTNMDSFHNESLSVIMKIAPYTVTHLFDPFHQIHIALPSEIKWIIVLLHHNRISSVSKSAWLQSGRSQVWFLGPDQHSESLHDWEMKVLPLPCK